MQRPLIAAPLCRHRTKRVSLIGQKRKHSLGIKVDENDFIVIL